MKTVAFAALALFAHGQPQPSSTASGAAPVDPALLPPITPTDPRFFTCEGTTCSGRIIEITPAENFILDCPEPNGCAGSQIFINVGNDPNIVPERPVENIEEIVFQAAGSGEGASITITNTLAATGHVVEVNDIVCEVAGSCTGLTVYASEGVDISAVNVDCAAPGSCVGCTVRVGGAIEQCGMNPVANLPAQQPPAVQPPQPGAPQQPQAGAPQIPSIPQMPLPQLQAPQGFFPVTPGQVAPQQQAGPPPQFV